MGSYIEYEGKLPFEFYSCVDCTSQIVGDISNLFILWKLNSLVRSAHLFPHTYISLNMYGVGNCFKWNVLGSCRWNLHFKLRNCFWIVSGVEIACQILSILSSYFRRGKVQTKTKSRSLRWRVDTEYFVNGSVISTTARISSVISRLSRDLSGMLQVW